MIGSLLSTLTAIQLNTCSHWRSQSYYIAKTSASIMVITVIISIMAAIIIIVVVAAAVVVLIMILVEVVVLVGGVLIRRWVTKATRETTTEVEVEVGWTENLKSRLSSVFPVTYSKSDYLYDFSKYKR